MQRDKRSIWNRSRKSSQFTPAQLQHIGQLVAVAMDEVFHEMNRVEDDLRNEMPEDMTGLQNDVEALERRVSDLEYAAS